MQPADGRAAIEGRHRAGLAVLFMLALSSISCLAEMSGEEYASGRVLSAAEREVAQRTIEAARLAAQRREAEIAEARRRQVEIAAQEYAARPLGARLLDQHCTGCHTLEPVLAKGRGWLGWQVTVARMRWWNGAKVPGNTVGPIVDYLHRQRTGTTMRQVGEFATLVAIVLSPGLWFGLRALRRRVVDEDNE